MQNATRTVHFSNIEAAIKSQLLKATLSVRICVAWINYDRYADVFERLVKRGIPIDIIINDDAINRKGFPDNIPGIRLVRISSKSGLLHNKFCVIDDLVVLSGSYNWSANAPNHFEQIDVTAHDYRLASQYIARFDELMAVANGGPRPAIRCNYDLGDRTCSANAFHLGMIGDAEGQYQTRNVAVWRVCFRHEHATFLTETFEDQLMERLGLDFENHPDWDEYGVSVDSERAKRQTAQRAANATRDFFNGVGGVPIHAVGQVFVLNELEHLEWNEDPVYGIGIIWKDTWFEHLIQNDYEPGAAGIDDIIDNRRRHRDHLAAVRLLLGPGNPLAQNSEAL